MQYYGFCKCIYLPCCLFIPHLSLQSIYFPLSLSLQAPNTLSLSSSRLIQLNIISAARSVCQWFAELNMMPVADGDLGATHMPPTYPFFPRVSHFPSSPQTH